MNSKFFLLLTTFCLMAYLAIAAVRNKREAWELPDGVDDYIGSIKSNFLCTSGRPGIYADLDNNCQLFHVCVPQEFPDGKTEIAQYTFACGNQTVFNQFSLTCVHNSEAIPCASSTDFFYLNERLGQPSQPIHADDDVARFNSLIGRQ